MRSVADPVLARRSVEPIGERSKSGPDVGGGGDPVLALMWAAVPEVGLGEEAVGDTGDMVLREARKAARGVKTRGGVTRTVKGGWSAIYVVTRGAGVEWLESCELL